MQKRGKLFILIGPTAVGKNTLISAVGEKLPELIRMPSATTRDKREGEIDGISKVFLTEEAFENYIEQDQFVEWQVIHGHKYGVLKKVVQDRIDQGKDYAADVEVLGAMKLKECYGDDAVLIFVVPPSLEVLEKRIRERNAETEDELQLRLSRSKSELTFIPKCDYILMNDNLEAATYQLEKIIVSERECVAQRPKVIEDISFTVVMTDKHKQEIFIDKENGCLLKLKANSSDFPHEQVSELLGQQNIEIQVLKDMSFQSHHNKGLDMPQPLWVKFVQEKTKVLIEYTYVVEALSVPSDLPHIGKQQLSNICVQLPMDQAVLQRELHKYM